jgi:signal-transduction protein with cAMP-binding, CBS, and nucleotidyltransferase domain
VLRHTQCFAHIKAHALSNIATLMETSFTVPMDPVFEQSQPADGIRIVAHGDVFNFVRALPWPRILGFSRSSDALGEESVVLFKSRMFMYGCIAQSHAELYLLRTHDVDVLAHTYPSFQSSLKTAASARLEELQQQFTAAVWTVRVSTGLEIV